MIKEVCATIVSRPRWFKRNASTRASALTRSLQHVMMYFSRSVTSKMSHFAVLRRSTVGGHQMCWLIALICQAIIAQMFAANKSCVCVVRPIGVWTKNEWMNWMLSFYCQFSCSRLIENVFFSSSCANDSILVTHITHTKKCYRQQMVFMALRLSHTALATTTLAYHNKWQREKNEKCIFTFICPFHLSKDRMLKLRLNENGRFLIYFISFFSHVVSIRSSTIYCKINFTWKFLN